MYRHILIPASQAADVEPMIRFAATLLDPDGEIRVLHVIPTPTLPQLAREWRSSINYVIPSHETAAALDIRVDPEVRVARDVAGEILDSAETHAVDAILMTLRGDKRSRNPFVGHTASALLHHAAPDVLIVNRLAIAEQQIPRILIPTFSSTTPPRALQIAEEFSMRNGGIPIVEITIARRGGPKAPPEEPSRSPRGLPLQHRRSFISESILFRRRRLPELIVSQAARERFGLLLVGEEPVHGEGPLLTRTFLEELFRAAPCPVMAVRD
ncbi:MAG: universal stress protein [Thermoplasmata archaeon]